MSKVIIIGAGIIGCGVARELSRYDVDITVLEKFNDVSCGTTKANSGIVHAGFDAKPNTLKAKFNLLGNAMFDELAKELDFPFKRNGALVLCFDKEGVDDLCELYQRGISNGVDGLETITGDKARELEPNISKQVVAALLAKSSGIVSPYEMAIAYAENAAVNGCKFVFEKQVVSITKKGNLWQVATQDGDVFEADFVINCAGVHADDINNIVCDKKIKIIPRRGEYMLYDKTRGYLATRTIFQMPTKMGKGILVAPTTHGNIITGPTAMDVDDKDDINTTFDGLKEVYEKSLLSVPELNKKFVITQFSGTRAHSVGGDFIIGESEKKGFYNVAGIESPGLTSAPAIAVHVADEVAQKLEVDKKADFVAKRKGIPHFATLSDGERQKLIEENPLYGKIVCRCEVVTEGEIVDSINRPIGAKDVDGVKRRTRAGMGKCQGGFCLESVMEILARELGVPFEEVLKDRNGKIVIGKAKNKR
ncbi:MAG: NAD(P)/FAD-dependent oxidoreductase [Clostridia bacterium]|nr:NAD(P)/FAD-dependent oxidoreductase [Clostridia bacterium]MDE7329444.1 NAD(P)/FAD-dependent oxidoreductase [Clostridia bacterium]